MKILLSLFRRLKRSVKSCKRVTLKSKIFISLRILMILSSHKVSNSSEKSTIRFKAKKVNVCKKLKAKLLSNLKTLETTLSQSFLR